MHECRCVRVHMRFVAITQQIKLIVIVIVIVIKMIGPIIRFSQFSFYISYFLFIFPVSHIFPIKLQKNINNKIISILKYYKISGHSHTIKKA